MIANLTNKSFNEFNIGYDSSTDPYVLGGSCAVRYFKNRMRIA